MVAFNSEYVCGPRQFVNYSKSRHSLHHVARNQMVQEMLGEYLWMVDTDHTFEPDIFARLVNAAKMFRLDVVSGLYLKKQPPYRPAAWKWNDDGGHSELSDISMDNVLQVGAVGAGCLLVHRRVFDRIEKEMKEDPFSVREFGVTTGEDFAFCKRLKMLNIPIGLVPWIQCRHLIVKPLDVENDFQRGVALPGEKEESVQINKVMPQEIAA